MGLVSTEQTTAILNSAAKLVEASNPDVIMKAEPNMNYWWLLAIAVVPVWFGWWLKRKKK